MGRLSFIKRYFSDPDFKMSISLTSSFVLNIVYALWEIFCGIYYQSYWFITLGFYYILLMLMRILLIREHRGKRISQNSGWKMYRLCGILLLFLNLVLTGIVVLAVMQGDGSHYAGYLIYAVAFYTFYRIIISIRNLVKYRKSHDPLISASNIISFVTAMISMLSLEIAMILHFGNDESFFRSMTILTGTLVCVIISTMAIHMLSSTKG